MPDTATPTTDRSARRRRYRVAMYAALAVGVVGYIAGLEADAPTAALAIYWAGFLGFLAVWKGSSMTLYDERHRALESTVAKGTLTVTAGILITVAPATPALATLGVEVPTLVQGALYGYAAVFGIYALVYTVVRLRA